MTVVALAALTGCGGSRLENASITFWGSDLLSVGPPGYSVSLALFGDLACKGANSSFTMTLDGAPLVYEDCVASASGFLENQTFTIQLHDGGDSAEVVVTDLFPGLQASVSGGGQVPPGGTFEVSVPAALQFETPLQFGAGFTYLDSDDPTYLGDATNPTASATGIQVVAPQHAGHFSLWISMSVPVPATYPGQWPKATVVSCTGLGSCSAFGAPDIGPLAIEVVGPAAAPAN